MGFSDIFKIKQYKDEIERLKSDNQNLYNKLNEIGFTEYEQVKNKIAQMENNFQSQSNRNNEFIKKQNATISESNNIISKLRDEIQQLQISSQKYDKQCSSQQRKLQRLKELYKSVSYCIENFNSDTAEGQVQLSPLQENEYDEFAPSVILKLHCMDIKDLRKAYTENDKQISKVLESYSARYTTKANKAIYQLMVIALRSELQNILVNLKYEKLDQSIDNVKIVTAKYLKIAGEGNQSIVGTLTKFIGEIEYLFINSVKIEYNYYVKKEQAKQEQLAIREQMRQEAEERKALEQEKKKVEKEESKYNTEIAKLQGILATTETDSEMENLQKRILELQSQLASVVLKKEEIANLQNGKAGNVYIISNLGSFGDDVFKIGMTRRLDPQERINELGSASVPFKFDVHSFIFSEDAVTLESELHNRLNAKRLNKVNLRKEFFKISLDDLEDLVTQIEPTAEFNKTMLAEEFRQSLSSDEIYTSTYSLNDYDIDEDE